jgi:chromosome partitioning protein
MANERFRKTAAARSIAVASRKGGVGKTFAAINIAICAATGGPDGNLPKLKVLFVEADSQQNSSYYFLKHFGAEVVGQKVILPPNPDCPDGKIYNISDNIAGNAYMEYPTQWENLYIIPSDGRIDKLQEVVKSDLDRFDEATINKYVTQVFNTLIEEVQDDYDLIVFDTPPSKTFASQGAIAASSDCLVVANPDAFCALNGVPGTISDIDMNNKTIRGQGNETNIIGILMNKVSSLRPTQHEKEHIRTMRKQFPQYVRNELVMCNYVSFNTEIPQSPNELEWMRHPQARQQMTNFYNHIANTTLADIYSGK